MNEDFWLEEERSVYLRDAFKTFLYNNSCVIHHHSKSHFLIVAQPSNIQR